MFICLTCARRSHHGNTWPRLATRQHKRKIITLAERCKKKGRRRGSLGKPEPEPAPSFSVVTCARVAERKYAPHVACKRASRRRSPGAGSSFWLPSGKFLVRALERSQLDSQPTTSDTTQHLIIALSVRSRTERTTAAFPTTCAIPAVAAFFRDLFASPTTANQPRSP